MVSWDFPGGPVLKNPPSNAGDAGSIPGRGIKIPHATGQLSPRASRREPECPKRRSPRTLEPAHHNEREKTCTPQLERSPHASAKIPRAVTKTRRSQKIN